MHELAIVVAIALCASAVSTCPPGSATCRTVAGVDIAWEFTADKSKVKVTATAAGDGWIGVGLGGPPAGGLEGGMVGGKVVIGRSQPSVGVDEHVMTGYTPEGAVAVAPVKSLDAGAKYLVSDGKAVLTFTTSAIAGQALSLNGTDTIIAAVGPNGSAWGYHFTHRASDKVTWTPPAGPTNAPTPAPPPTPPPTAAPTNASASKAQVTIAGVDVVWELTADKKKVKVTATAAGSAWIAVGLGSAMTNGKVVIGRAQPSFSVDEYTISGKQISDIAPVANASRSLDAGATFVQDGKSTILAFTTSAIAGQALSLSGTDSIIVAVGQPTNAWGFHSNKGVGSVNWAAGSSDTSTKTPALLWVHVICLCLAWTLLLPSGIVSAMLGRHKPDAWWFKTHQKVQAAGVGFLLVGYICSITHVGWSAGVALHGNHPHKVIGHIVSVISLVQPINAYFRPHKSDTGSQTTVRVAWELAHKNLGRVGALLSVINVIWGFVLACAQGYKDLMAVAIVLSAIGYVVSIGLAVHLVRTKHEADTNTGLTKGLTGK